MLVQSQESQIDSSIHMLFMQMDLAVVWMDSSFEVVDVRHAKRWRFAYVPRKPAQYVLEIPAEHLTQFRIGDKVLITDEKTE